jgi:hypothetical protein
MKKNYLFENKLFYHLGKKLFKKTKYFMVMTVIHSIILRPSKEKKKSCANKEKS